MVCIFIFHCVTVQAENISGLLFILSIYKDRYLKLSNDLILAGYYCQQATILSNIGVCDEPKDACVS